MMIRKKHYEHHLKAKALEPQERFCALIKKRVCILIEYQDYKSINVKGEPGTLYCENIIDCYQNDRHCKWSGISPSYPDPLVPLEEMARFLEPGESVEEKRRCS
ncbi:MAG: hypothetical protein RDV48_22875 [Candidatus Eremiobacteraeota bacterium]|nr:hypothetical protein [Candidatus Eremiobacteraeota bacterium]